MKNFFEWYYFDLHTEDGFDLIFTLHSRPFMSVFAVSIFDFFIYKDNELQEHRFFTLPSKNVQHSKDGSEIYYNENNYLSNDGLNIKVRAQSKDISLKLDFINLIKDTDPLIKNLLPEPITAEKMDDYLDHAFATYPGVTDLIEWCRSNAILFIWWLSVKCH